MPKSARLRALDHAVSYLGTKENPPGSNRGRLIDQWNKAAGVPVGSPWCMSFLRAMFRKAGVQLGGGASVGFFEEWAVQHGELIVSRPFKGDIICYRFDSDNWPDHVGIVERVLALRWQSRVFTGWVQTVEGNTAWGDDADGGQVQRRRRWISRAKFVRIRDPIG